MDQQALVERARRTYLLIEEKFKTIGVVTDFVMKTGFISWLNESPDRIQRYEQDDVNALVNEYVDACINEDNVEELDE